MRQHAHLAAMMGFMHQYVTQHLRAHRPRPRPAVPAEGLHSPTAAQRFSQHLSAAIRTLRQSRTGLLWCAVHAAELGWNLQVRSREPDPFAPRIVHMREDRPDG